MRRDAMRCDAAPRARWASARPGALPAPSGRGYRRGRRPGTLSRLPGHRDLSGWWPRPRRVSPPAAQRDSAREKPPPGLGAAPRRLPGLSRSPVSDVFRGLLFLFRPFLVGGGVVEDLAGGPCAPLGRESGCGRRERSGPRRLARWSLLAPRWKGMRGGRGNRG